jgi:hypothetical protein
MRRQATTTGGEQQAATRALISLYKELSASTKLTDADRRSQLAYVRNRLRRTSQALEHQLAGSGDSKLADDPASQPAAQALLAQVRGNPARQQAGAAARPGNLLAPAPAQNGGVSLAAMTNQNAQELVDLIQTTIAPHTWDVNGGHGVIRYFAPAQVLVIRQSGGVHGQVGQALQNLRKAP